jgi:hypothetical protein
MRVYGTVKLNRYERQVLSEAAVHMRVAFPDEGSEVRQYPPRIASSLGNNGEAINGQRADVLIDGLRQTLVACQEQSDPAWWEDQLGVTVAGGTESREGVGLIANPPQFCKDMADNRAAQGRRVREALDLMVRVRDAIGEDPEEED